jgi:hypothetical protein
VIEIPELQSWKTAESSTAKGSEKISGIDDVPGAVFEKS